MWCPNDISEDEIERLKEIKSNMPDSTETTVKELIERLQKYPMDAVVNIQIVAQSGTYSISDVWMNRDHTEIFLHGTV